jgi:hypothetical protein
MIMISLFLFLLLLLLLFLTHSLLLRLLPIRLLRQGQEEGVHPLPSR